MKVACCNGILLSSHIVFLFHSPGHSSWPLLRNFLSAPPTKRGECSNVPTLPCTAMFPLTRRGIGVVQKSSVGTRSGYSSLKSRNTSKKQVCSNGRRKISRQSSRLPVSNTTLPFLRRRARHRNNDRPSRGRAMAWRASCGSLQILNQQTVPTVPSS